MPAHIYTQIYIHKHIKVIIHIVSLLVVCVCVFYLVNFSSSLPSTHISLNATPLPPVTHINYLLCFLPYIFPHAYIHPCTYNCKDTTTTFFPLFFSNYYTQFSASPFSHSIMVQKISQFNQYSPEFLFYQLYNISPFECM